MKLLSHDIVYSPMLYRNREKIKLLFRNNIFLYLGYIFANRNIFIVVMTSFHENAVSPVCYLREHFHLLY